MLYRIQHQPFPERAIAGSEDQPYAIQLEDLVHLVGEVGSYRRRILPN